MSDAPPPPPPKDGVNPKKASKKYSAAEQAQFQANYRRHFAANPTPDARLQTFHRNGHLYSVPPADGRFATNKPQYRIQTFEGADPTEWLLHKQRHLTQPGVPHSLMSEAFYVPVDAAMFSDQIKHNVAFYIPMQPTFISRPEINRDSDFPVPIFPPRDTDQFKELQALIMRLGKIVQHGDSTPLILVPQPDKAPLYAYSDNRSTGNFPISRAVRELIVTTCLEYESLLTQGVTASSTDMSASSIKHDEVLKKTLMKSASDIAAICNYVNGAVATHSDLEHRVEAVRGGGRRLGGDEPEIIRRSTEPLGGNPPPLARRTTAFSSPGVTRTGTSASEPGNVGGKVPRNVQDLTAHQQALLYATMQVALWSLKPVLKLTTQVGNAPLPSTAEYARGLGKWLIHVFELVHDLPLANPRSFRDPIKSLEEFKAAMEPMDLYYSNRLSKYRDYVSEHKGKTKAPILSFEKWTETDWPGKKAAPVLDWHVRYANATHNFWNPWIKRPLYEVVHSGHNQGGPAFKYPPELGLGFRLGPRHVPQTEKVTQFYSDSNTTVNRAQFESPYKLGWSHPIIKNFDEYRPPHFMPKVGELIVAQSLAPNRTKVIQSAAPQVSTPPTPPFSGIVQGNRNGQVPLQHCLTTRSRELSIMAHTVRDGLVPFPNSPRIALRPGELSKPKGPTIGSDGKKYYETDALTSRRNTTPTLASSPLHFTGDRQTARNPYNMAQNFNAAPRPSPLLQHPAHFQLPSHYPGELAGF